MRERALDAVLALALALGAYALLGDVGFELTDEGYLWYGVQRAELGEVPRLDFRGYDAGRYYWCVAWAPLFGTGLLGMRLSLAMYQAVGLFFGLRVARRALKPGETGLPLLLVGLGVLLTIWEFPRQKVFEHTSVLITVWVVMRWLEQRDLRRAFAAGFWTGLALFMGRNHALYAGLSSVAVLGWIGARESLALCRDSLGSFSAGVAVGLLPTVAMMLLIPGLAATNWELAMALVHRSSNLSMDVPWPWTIDFAAEDPGWATQLLGTGISYMLMCAVYLLGAIAVVRTSASAMHRRAAFAACIFVGISWAHHAAVRSEAGHLAQAAHPLWLALFAAPLAFDWAQRQRVALASGITLVTLTAAVPIFADGRWQGLVSDSWKPLEVGDDSVRAPAWIVDYVQTIDGLVSTHVAESELILIAPFDPTFYPYFGKKSPIYDTYQLWPSSNEAQQAAIAALEAQDVRWALLGTTIVSGSPQTHYSHTNPLVLAYLQQNFEPVPGVAQFPGRMFLQRRSLPTPQP